MVSNFISDKKQLFDNWAPNYDWVFTSFIYQAIHKRLLSKVELPERVKVLDLGCGTGRLLDRLVNHFPDLQGTGLDFSAQMLQVARQKNRHYPRLIYIQGEADSLPFNDNQFDAVFNTISFLHYSEPEKVLNEVARVLKPSGRFYLVDITSSGEGTSQLAAHSPARIRIYSREARERLGLSAGLSCLGHYYLLGPVLLTIFKKSAW